MLYAAIALFAVAAVLGLIILLKWLSKNDASKGVIYSHGIIAATALVLIIVYALQNPAHYPQLSIILFVLGALGGFYLFFNNLKSNARPIGIAFVHALIAVAGFVTLLIFAFA
ncbi:MAG TPA: hypothetical protein PKN99_10910 [Cyclobacteriaceae bacterium]|jgi:hypothetical protein|nr:hypothetical protein [Cyclobacteriaceae bacterium]HNP08127.1 hypothetical protein [Cyclobacteriaceae bacterium]HRK53412.1 hypothetical protein [Cyclobacteriaceae bacterium]